MLHSMEGKFYVGSLEVHKIFPPWELGVKCHFCVVISYAPSTHCKLVLNLLHKLCVSWWLWAIKSAPGEEELVVCSK